MAITTFRQTFFFKEIGKKKRKTSFEKIEFENNNRLVRKNCDPKKVEKLLKEGESKALKIASKNLKEIRALVGIKSL